MGGGPAGSAVAIHLASAGVETVLFERLRAPRWRAAGVYSSPGTRQRLLALGLPPPVVSALIRPIDAMEVVAPRGTVCRLAYDAPHQAGGLDRVRLERALLDRAERAGAIVHEGATVRAITTGGKQTLEVSTLLGLEHWRAGLVIGADGPRSLVARTHGVDRRARRSRRAGLTHHRTDPDAAAPGVAMSARMILGDGWYCGVAPVPGERVNIGIVMPERRLRDELARGIDPSRLVSTVTDALPAPRAAWQDAPSTDAVTVAVPLAHRVTRLAGPGFLLVGDAAGFIDPLSGEGLYRALVSAELAADAVSSWRRGDTGAVARYEGRMRARFAPRDLVSGMLQAFLSRPGALDYAVRRLARRDQLRATFARALADIEPASSILGPRFLLSLLAP